MNKNLLIIIIGAIVLCFTGFNNKFPLLTESSGIYINSGFLKEVPSDRPLLYGLFVAHSSWGKSLWFTIISQALILSLVLFYFFRYFNDIPYRNVLFSAYIFFISFFTPVSIMVSSISPGIFLSIAILGTGLLLFAKNLIKRDFLIIAGLVAFSCGMDISYMLICLSLILLVGIIFVFTKKNKPMAKITSIKRLLTINAIIVLGWILSTSLHFLLVGNIEVFSEHNISMLHHLSGVNIDQYSIIQNDTETFKSLFHRFNDDVREFYLSWQRLGFLSIISYYYCQVLVVILSLCIFIYTFRRLLGTKPYYLFLYLFLACTIYFIISLINCSNTGLKNTITWILSLPIYFYIFRTEYTEILKININKLYIPDNNTNQINS